ncbi:MAG TPA: ABC transporter permease [Streptosporangiaceae bacterium]|nr:ABC transporter permease [Streptosporangiaceae bacterium]
MSTSSYAIRDSVTMLRRDLLHVRRYPSMTFGVLLIPVFMLLLFRYVFGATLGAGIGARTGGYINYLTPGIIVLAVSSASVAIAVAINMDMTEGIINRFRTMAIARVCVLTGHVLGSVVQTVAGAVLVTGLAVALGFRPAASVAGWLAAIALIVVLAFALTWVSVALGLLAKNPEGASNAPLPLALLPFLGSAFVPAGTMAPGVRWFAEYQPFTPVIETLRGLLLGTPAGDKPLIAYAWCAGLAVAGYLGSRALFNRGTTTSRSR